jgi:hypothetical protein
MRKSSAEPGHLKPADRAADDFVKFFTNRACLPSLLWLEKAPAIPAGYACHPHGPPCRLSHPTSLLFAVLANVHSYASELFGRSSVFGFLTNSVLVALVV